MLLPPVFLLLPAVALLSRAQSPQENFDEKLTISPLKDGKVVSTLAFTTVLKHAAPRDPAQLHLDDDSQHYTLFPLALGQILREYGVTEMHLTLNAGKWNYDSWGMPVEPGVGTGAELWAWIGDGAVSSVDARWKGLRNALAGLFCASLGSLDDLRTTSPSSVFTPEGSLPPNTPHQLRHASHPSEHVCTENLTPFVKLLPCKASAGLATLLNPHKLFDANWHGMGVHVLWREEAQSVEVRLTFQVVSDPVRSPIAKKQDWSFNTLFGRKIERACPAARSSTVELSLPTTPGGDYTIVPPPTEISPSTYYYDLHDLAHPIDLSMAWKYDFDRSKAFQSTEASSAPLSIQRTLTGSSQAHGHFSLTLTNRSPFPIRAIYLETMPWIIQFYLHTLTASVDPSSSSHHEHEDAHTYISKISYIPAIPHSRPTTFSAVLTIPGNATLRLGMQVTKAFLRYTEHPPDAQRGWDLPPAVVLPVLEPGLAEGEIGGRVRSEGNEAHGQRMYTPTLLVDLATPDFSMPYNVIIFTCTLVAFVFGSVFNVLTRRFVVVRVGEGEEKGKEGGGKEGSGEVEVMVEAKEG